MMRHTKYQGSRPFDFRQEDFNHVFPIEAYVKYVTRGLAIFGPRGTILTILVDDATDQITRLYALWFKTRLFFSSFPYKGLCLKHVTP